MRDEELNKNLMAAAGEPVSQMFLSSAFLLGAYSTLEAVCKTLKAYDDCEGIAEVIDAWSKDVPAVVVPSIRELRNDIRADRDDATVQTKIIMQATLDAVLDTSGDSMFAELLDVLDKMVEGRNA